MADPGGDCEWQERLQDWIDGDLDSGESEAVLTHTARCTSCYERLDALWALDDQLAKYLPPMALNDPFNQRVLAAVDSASRDFAAARARLERDWQSQQASLLGSRRTIWNWIMLDLFAISLLTGLATTFRSLPGVASRLDRLLALTAHPAWSVPLSLTVISAVVALAIVRVLATSEHG